MRFKLYVATSQVYYMSMHVFVILFMNLCETILTYQSDMFRNFFDCNTADDSAICNRVKSREYVNVRGLWDGLASRIVYSCQKTFLAAGEVSPE